MSIKIIMPFFIVKEKNWFWPTRWYVIFLVIGFCCSIHNLLFVPSTITWWIYYITTPETSALSLTWRLDNIPKHETSSCPQGPYIVVEEKASRDPYMVYIIWPRKELKCICALVVWLRSQVLGKRLKWIISYVWRNQMWWFFSLIPHNHQMNLPVTKKRAQPLYLAQENWEKTVQFPMSKSYRNMHLDTMV